MNDESLLRYARQIMLPEIDVDGQARLVDSTAVIFGLGGLGSPAAMYLAATGVGRLVLVDFDVVELSNLQRQIIHYTSDIGSDKIVSAQTKLHALNPEVSITAIKSLKDDELINCLADADVVLDGTDNFSARFAINKACVHAGAPLVSASVIGYSGQLAIFRGYLPDEACYQCLYAQRAEEQQTCVSTGVLAPVAGMIGCMQALEAVKAILNLGSPLYSRLLLIEGLDLRTKCVKINKDPACSVCNISARQGLRV